MKPGDMVLCNITGQRGIILKIIQVAWGSTRYKILFENNTTKYVWNKHLHLEVISED
tara:strand:- start:425 stop:595 length:171 start_codon:yes stop_codon:yes gene_type:complete